MTKLIGLKPYKQTSSGIVTSKPCILHSMLLGMDGVNDTIVTAYDGTDNTGDEIVPTVNYDASALNLNGFTNIPIECKVGLYIEITTLGAAEIETYRKQW